ncbi:ribbon-helix-helix protein, CopG family [Olsenella sp. An188]
MKRNEKERFRRLAKNHGLSLSAFLRLAANDYIERNDWE